MFCLPFRGHELKIVVDSITMDYVNLATIDFTESLMSSSFVVVDNPRAEMGCSCGSSFAPKMD